MQQEEKKESTPPTTEGATAVKKFTLTDEEQLAYDKSTTPVLDLSLVCQKAIPGVWNQIHFTTFPCNWMVIGHLPGDARDKMVLQGEGPGGVQDAVRHLKDDEIQYAGFRVTVTLDSTSMHDFDEPDDVFVLVRWIGRHTTTQQRSNIEEEMAFMREYFHDHHVDVELVDHEDGEEVTNREERTAWLTSHVKKIVQSHVASVSEEHRQLLRFDFANTSHTSVCTHYDFNEPFETEENSNAAMTHDALFNAMKDLQKEKDDGVGHEEGEDGEQQEDVPYFKEAKEYYHDRDQERRRAAASTGVVDVVNEVPSMEAMEGQELQYQYNTFDLDHGEEEANLPSYDTKTSDVVDHVSSYDDSGGVAPALVPAAALVPPPAAAAPPAPQSLLPLHLGGIGNTVPTDETDALILERLRVEEESLILRRQLAIMTQEQERRSSKKRIQARLEARRQKKLERTSSGTTTTTTTSTTTTTVPSSSSSSSSTGTFFSELSGRAESSRNRTAERVASRATGSPLRSTAPAQRSTREDDLARMLAQRQQIMSERLKEVEARIERNNADLSKESSSSKS